MGYKKGVKMGYKKMKDIEELWEIIKRYEGETFYTATKLPFTYEIVNNHILVPYRDGSPKWPLSKNVFNKGLKYLNCSLAEFNYHIIASSYVREILLDERIAN